MVTKMKIETRLKELREQNNLSIAQMASIFDTSEENIESWENNIYLPPTRMVVLLAEHFDCSIDYLLGVSDRMGESPKIQYQRISSEEGEKAETANSNAKESSSSGCFVAFFVAALVVVLFGILLSQLVK